MFLPVERCALLAIGFAFGIVSFWLIESEVSTEMAKQNNRMSEKFSNALQEEANEIVNEIVDDLLLATFDNIDLKVYNFKLIEMHFETLHKALEDILDAYEKPEPCNDHTHIIDAWKRDKPSKPSEPDSLIKGFI